MVKVTAIRPQASDPNRFSIYVDDGYSFSLSAEALIDSKIAKNQELTEEEVEEFVKLSNTDKLYRLVFRYALNKRHTEYEIRSYLKRKEASPALIDILLNKLSKISLINDEQLAIDYIKDSKLLSPASTRKIKYKLKTKGINESIIERAFKATGDSLEEIDDQALRHIIERKRRQAKYQDNEKLMQYLARQGFSYQSIKDAIRD